VQLQPRTESLVVFEGFGFAALLPLRSFMFHAEK